MLENSEEGLMIAMQELASNTKKTFNVPCVLKCNKLILIHNEIAVINLYRIAQEAVTNAVKHGKPENIRICLNKEHNTITMTIENDGTGIPDMTKRRNGMGLQIMKYRANMIGASLDIHSRINGGTLVTCIYTDKSKIEVKISEKDESLITV